MKCIQLQHKLLRIKNIKYSTSFKCIQDEYEIEAECDNFYMRSLQP